MGNILCGLEPMGGDTKKGAEDWIGLGVELVEDLLSSSIVKLVLGEGVLLFGFSWVTVVLWLEGEVVMLEQLSKG